MTKIMTLVAALFALLTVSIATPSLAASGKVAIEVRKTAILLGVQEGTGTLTFKGRRYGLVIGGVGFGATVGASSAQLVGTVTNIRRARDIAGQYTAGQAGLTVIGGGKVTRLTNEKGVVLELSGPQVGLEVSLDLGGMTISVK